ncbi:MAG: APC family permease [Bacteroidetes Order II. Incertae sedis bacterium]|nr:APC family permease [Bacteroidetes Order II. bacterium]
MKQPKLAKIGWITATALVVSNMIGTGVFTSLGFQLTNVQNTVSIVLLWLIGGVLALIGAFTVAELGTYHKRSGGDYIFISEAFHPFFGYLSGWTSLVAGFSAPVAIAAIAMEDYFKPLGVPYTRYLSVVLILGLSAMHSISIKHSGWFQLLTTIVKALFIGILLALPFFFGGVPNHAINFYAPIQPEVFSTGFAVSLLYVTYAYTGWNAAAYIVGEIDQPQKNLPKALLTGTLIVTIVYIALQLVFLQFARTDQLTGKSEVALVAIQNIFGNTGANWVSLGIAVQLVATMSSYIWIGSRITHTMAQQHGLWQFLRPCNAAQVPVRALWLQTGITLILLFSGTLEEVLLYTSFVLQLMGTLAVASLLRTKRTVGHFHSPLRPYIQWAYVLFSCAVLIFIMQDRPKESISGLLMICVGGATYFFSKVRYNTK